MDEESRKRTLEWARKFREAAAAPDPENIDIHPDLIKAHREACLSTAEDLERQAGEVE